MSEKYIVAPPMGAEDTSSLGAKDAVWGDAYIKRLHGKAKEEIDTAINAVKLAVGGPQKADTVADMTDKTKVYVYTGSEENYTTGAWYYFDTAKDAWEKGGLYNETAVETDKTLTASGVAADAAVVGERLTTQDTKVDNALQTFDQKVSSIDTLSAVDASLQQQITKEKVRATQAEDNLASSIKQNTDSISLVDAKYASAVEFKPIKIKDSWNRFLTDELGNYIVAMSYLPFVDTTMTQKDIPADARAVGTMLNVIRNDADAEKRRSIAKDDELSAAIDSTNENVKQVDDKYMSAVALKQVTIVDESGNFVTDSAGQHVTVGTYLPVVDTTLTKKDMPADAQATGKRLAHVQTILTNKMGLTFASEYKKFDLPILYLSGRINELVDKSVTLKDEVSYSFPYLNIEGTLKKCKVQGGSSASLPKKNYTLTFPTDFEAKSGWGEHHKYVIKANYIDFTQARNVVCANLWGDLRKTRVSLTDALLDTDGNYIADSDSNHLLTDSNPSMVAGVNCGAVDGFPIMVVINNEYWGLYTFNSPKDDWMASMGDRDKECIVSTDYSSTQAEYFKGEPTMKAGTTGNIDFEIEYVTDEDDSDWVLESLKTMIAAVMSSTGTTYKDSISDYIDVDSAMDYMIFSALIGNTDGVGKNYLLQTFNGTKWYFCAYDLDNVFGALWRGQAINSPAMSACTLKDLQNAHRMFHLIYAYDTDALISRYHTLRNGILSEANVITKFSNFARTIPFAAKYYENLRWAKTPCTDVYTIDQIANWYRLRVQLIDNEITELEKEQ